MSFERSAAFVRRSEFDVGGGGPTAQPSSTMSAAPRGDDAVVRSRWFDLPMIMRSPARRAAVSLMICNYAQAAVGFALQLWLANRLGAEGYGTVSYCLIVGAVCNTLVMFGSDRTLVRDLMRATEPRTLLTGSMVQRTVVAFLVLGGCGVYAVGVGRVEPAKMWAVLAGGVWGATMGLMPTAWLDSRYEMGVGAWLTLLERILFGMLAIGLLAGIFTGSPVILTLGSLVGARLAGGVAQWLYATRSFRPVWRGSTACAWRLTRENVLVFGAVLASLLLTHWNQIVLESQAGLARLAHYAVAFQLVSLVTIAQAQIVRLLTPQISLLTRAEGDSGAGRRGLLRHGGYAAAASLVLALPLSWLAPWILAVGYRPEYQSAATPLRILCLWVMCYGPGLIINQYVLCLGLNRAYFLLTVASGVSGLVLGQILVPRLGASGVALSLLCSHVPSIAIQGALALRRMRPPRQEPQREVSAATAVVPPPPIRARPEPCQIV